MGKIETKKNYAKGNEPMINKFFGHLKTILKHKWWVFYYCCKFGIPWRGIKHDMSKFSPTEFWESMRYYQGNRSPIDACKEQNGYSKAWQHHKGRNTHHYEYWQDNFDKGTDHLLMPFNDIIEMICDYLGAGRAYSGKNFSFENELKWWEQQKIVRTAMNSLPKRMVSLAFESLVNDMKIKDIKKQLKHLYIKDNCKQITHCTNKEHLFKVDAKCLAKCLIHEQVLDSNKCTECAIDNIESDEVRPIVTYQCTDGTEFTDFSQAIEYEADWLESEAILD